MRHVLAAAGLLLLGGCAAAELREAPDAGAGHAASAVAADVEVTASPGAWRGWPADLTRVVTPILVSIVNRGAAPVRVSHDDFALVLPGGRRLAVVLPSEVRGVVYDPPPTALPSEGFSVGGDGYPGGPDWVLRGPAAGAYTDPVARVGEQFALPTPDVLDRALPEGVLEPGRAASGFVYFERLAADAGRVDLSARLVDARTGDTLGRVLVPFTLSSPGAPG
jgi:hypothetical protein